MAVNGKFTDITRYDLLAVADRFGIGTAPQVLKQVSEAISAWPDFAAQAGVGLPEVRRILKHHRALCVSALSGSTRVCP
jgi:serine/threonine-protein kinase HipA